MAIRPNKTNVSISNQQLALELVKAALAGGAIKGSTVEKEDIQDIDSVNMLVLHRARLDAAYIVRLYSGLVNRLEQEQAAIR
ncbi:hypothetical protein GCM10025795_13170 [Verticiella sediminum]